MKESSHANAALTTIPSDRYVQLIFGQIPGAVWATDNDLRVTYMQGTLAIRGIGERWQHALTAEPTLDLTVEDIAAGTEGAERIVAHHRAALAGVPQSYGVHFQGRWLDVRVEPLRADDAAIVGCVGVAIDRTKQKQVERQLALSSRRLEEAQRFAHVGSFEWDVARDAIAWSDELHRIFGIEKGQFAGTAAAFFERVHPDDLERMRRSMAETLKDAKPFAHEHRIVRPDGSVRLLQTRGDVVTDDAGTPLRVVGSSWDATDATAAIVAQQHALSLVAATLDATADGVLVVDQGGSIAARNQRFNALWQIPPALAASGGDEALLAFVIDQLEDPDAFLRGVRDLYGHPARESLDTLRFKDGRVFERNSIPQRIGDEIVGRVWSFRDVTERDRWLRRVLFLADATRLLASLDVEAALDGVARLAVPFLARTCAVDLIRDGVLRRLLIVSEDTPWPVELEAPPSVLAGHATLSRRGSASCLYVPMLVKGEVVGAFTFISAPERDYGQAELELANELAQRAALSVENARLFRGAQDALHARDELLAVAAHEIRGPISSMRIATQALSRAVTQPSPATTERLLAIIERDNRRLARFVDELVDVGRLRSGQVRFEFQEVDLRAIVFEVAARFVSEIERSGSSLTVHADANVVGEWDPFRLDQIVTNLLLNAIKFGEGKPISITVKALDGTASLSVEDNGIGIPSAKLEHIFEPFERAVSIRHYGGLGLGLHIVRVIVDGLGGSVRVVSKPGAGSSFTVELPRSRSP